MLTVFRGQQAYQYTSGLALYNRRAVLPSAPENRLVVYRKPRSTHSLSKRASFEGGTQIKEFNYRDMASQGIKQESALTTPPRSAHMPRVRPSIFSVNRLTASGVASLATCVHDLESALTNLKQAAGDAERVLASVDPDYDYTEMVLYWFLLEITQQSMSEPVIAGLSQIGVRDTQGQRVYTETLSEIILPSYLRELEADTQLALEEAQIESLKKEVDNFFNLVFDVKRELLRVQKQVKETVVRGRNLLHALNQGQCDKQHPAIVSIKSEIAALNQKLGWLLHLMHHNQILGSLVGQGKESTQPVFINLNDVSQSKERLAYLDEMLQ